MKHDRLRRHGRRHADPAVIHLPSQLPPHTPPRDEPEAGGLIVLDDEAELLAHGNIFEVEPRMSRQARRKALRAEKRAARHAATQRFLVGAPSMAEAASQLEETETVEDWAEETRPPVSEHEAAVALLADLLVAERPVPEVLIEDHFMEDVEDLEVLEDMPAEPVSIETVAAMVSMSGPLIVEIVQSEAEAPRTDDLEVYGPAQSDALIVARPVETTAQASASIMADAVATEAETEMPEPSWLEATPVAPLPRNRALVAHKRHWLLRLVPWLARRPAPAPEPAMAQLQELRFELVTALRKLDRIIEQTA